jgi:sugar lactone lactonase YvrE
MTRLASLVALALAAPAVSAHPGIGIVVDSRGNVFYTDLKQVWRIAPDGTRSVAVPGVHTHELYLDLEDNVFGQHLWYEGEASDTWGHRVWKLSRDGKLEDVIPATRGFLERYSFVRDRQGNMYWAGDGEGDASDRVWIQKLAPDGTLTRLAGGEAGRADGIGAAAQFEDLRWISATPEGVVHAIDAGRLRRIAPDGTVTTLASLAEGGLGLLGGKKHRLFGLCADPAGNVYVANLWKERVERVTPKGEVTVFAEGCAPTGVTLSPAGDVYVLEGGDEGARVRRFRPDGTEIPLAQGAEAEPRSR